MTSFRLGTFRHSPQGPARYPPSARGFFGTSPASSWRMRSAITPPIVPLPSLPPMTSVFGMNGTLLFGKGFHSVHQRRGVRSQCCNLPFVGLRPGQTDRSDLRALSRAGLLDERRLSLGFHLAGRSPVALDVHPNLGFREVRLHVRGAFGLLGLDALVLG